MKENLLIGWGLVFGVIGVFIPYSILTVTFDYPDILRLPGGEILSQFHQGGAFLIFTWLAFALLGFPLLLAYVLIGQKYEPASKHVRWITVIGIISAVVQMIGLLRWVFVVPVLAQNYIASQSIQAKEFIVVVFNAVHQFGGVLLGEHLGQLFTIIWTIGISIVLLQLKEIPRYLSYFGILSSLIYLLAQAELFATVISNFAYIGIAGFLGSTLWLLWLVVLGVFFITKK